VGWYSIRKGDNKPLQVNKGGICGVLGVVVSVPAGWVKGKENTNIKHQYQPKLYPTL